MGGQAETVTVTLSGSITTRSDGRLYPATPAIGIKDLPVPAGYTPEGPKVHLAIILGVVIPVAVFILASGGWVTWMRCRRARRVPVFLPENKPVFRPVIELEGTPVLPSELPGSEPPDIVSKAILASSSKATQLPQYSKEECDTAI